MLVVHRCPLNHLFNAFLVFVGFHILKWSIFVDTDASATGGGQGTKGNGHIDQSDHREGAEIFARLLA